MGQVAGVVLSVITVAAVGVVLMVTGELVATSATVILPQQILAVVGAAPTQAILVEAGALEL